MNFKDIINKCPKINISNIKNRIDRCETISFDIFDTLLKRDVQSECDVFDLTEKLFNLNFKIKLYGYRTVRKKAEEKARTQSEIEEITVEQLQGVLIGEKSENGIEITKEIAEALINCEREIERNVCIKNEILYPVYKYCIEKKKRIIIISDMYWDKEFLEELLKRNDIEKYDALYVSSEYGKQKSTGSLYDVVLGEEEVFSSSILHIGDNKKGDFLVARKYGLRVISIPKLADNTKYVQKSGGDSLKWKCCNKFINNRMPALNNPIECIGYEVYGPLLYSFIKWLSTKLDRDKTTLFFARDCYVVKLAYELYTREISEKNVYFLGSRRSLIIPSLRNGAELDKVAILIKSESRKLTISGLLMKLGVNSKLYINRLTQYGLTENSILDRDNLYLNNKFMLFYESIRADIEKNAKEEYEAFTYYWDSLKCTREIQIVDIGWRGTMQHCLEDLIGHDYDIKGFYLGIRKDATISNYEDIYLNGKEDFEKECFLAGMTSLIEIFFSAPHGSVKRYKGNGQIEYMPYECENDEESKILLEELQRGANKFMRDYSESMLSQLVPISSTHMFYPLFKMGTEPKKEELQVFGQYPFQMGAGVMRNINTRGVLRYIRNPKDFVNDFSNSNWKVGFLKKCMRLKMPYYTIFKWIYKHRG